MSRSKARSEHPSGRFDLKALRSSAGETVFDRGASYFESGRVELVCIDDRRVLARVSGTEVYSAELKGRGRDFSGRCTCPAFEDWGFCKHLVATALEANASGADAAVKTQGREQKLRAYLSSLRPEALVDLVLAWTGRDPALLEEIELAAAMATDDDDTLKGRLSRMVCEAIDTGGYVDYQGAGAWAEDIGRALDQVEALVGHGRAAMALELVDLALDHLQEALDSVDDSEGEGSEQLWRLAEIHQAAWRAMPPDPAALARDLLDKEMEAQWDHFSGALDTYADLLGETGLAEYRRLAHEAWTTLRSHRNDARRSSLAGIIDRLAARDGDLDARIALRAADLSSAHDYLGLARLCLDGRRPDDALKWAQEGCWRFEDRPDQRLEVFTAELLRQRGCAAEAGELLWRVFERAPSLELVRQLKAQGDETAALERVLSVLRDRARAASDWRSREAAGLLVQVLIDEGRLAEAHAAAAANGCSDSVLEALAKASEPSLPALALEVYERLVEARVADASRSGYEAARRLVGRMGELRRRGGADHAQAAYVQNLMTRHRLKRSFVKMLQDG